MFSYASYKYVDGAHSAYASSDDETSAAAMETIETPEKHLLTQSQIFDAEGGFGGLALQSAGAMTGFLALCAYRKNTMAYLRNAQLKWWGFAFIGASMFVGYQAGHTAGVHILGEPQKLHNHWVAY